MWKKHPSAAVEVIAKPFEEMHLAPASFDLAIYHNLVWNIAHGNFLASTLVLVASFFVPGGGFAAPRGLRPGRRQAHGQEQRGGRKGAGPADCAESQGSQLAGSMPVFSMTARVKHPGHGFDKAGSVFV